MNTEVFLFLNKSKNHLKQKKLEFTVLHFSSWTYWN